MHNYIIQKVRFSAGKNGAIISEVALVQSGSHKMGRIPQIRSRRSVVCNVPTYSLVVGKKWSKSSIVSCGVWSKSGLSRIE